MFTFELWVVSLVTSVTAAVVSVPAPVDGADVWLLPDVVLPGELLELHATAASSVAVPTTAMTPR